MGSRAAGRVYPRVYGGTRRIGRGVYQQSGLSPRVRGNPRHLQREVNYQRSIPACTGEPCQEAGAQVTVEVYPRVYGGT